MNTHRKQKKQLTAAVLAALLAMPAYGHAFVSAPEYVYYNGKPVVEMQFLTQGEEIKGMVDKAGYTLNPSLIEPVKASMAYWTGLIGPKAKNETPWQVFVTMETKEPNASANTKSFLMENGKLRETSRNFVAQQLHDGKKLLRMTKEIGESTNPPPGDYGFSIIGVGHKAAERKPMEDDKLLWNQVHYNKFGNTK